MGKYFGTDGIRGKANEKLTPDLALKIGQALGIVFKNGERRHRVVIGKDTRLSGYMIENALVAGLTSMGMDVTVHGPMPTAGVGMLTGSVRADLGIMITASHNKFHDNGIKIFYPDGNKLSDETEAEIEKLLVSDLSAYLADPRSIGRARRIEDAQARYVEHVKRSVDRTMDLEGLRIVIDCANGAAYNVAPKAFSELGPEIITIGCEPDGFNINDGVGSTAPHKMCEKVREIRADIGIAFDGDADRVIIADEKGAVIDGDQILAVLARAWKAEGQLKKPIVVGTVMSNIALERYLGTIGISLERTAVGDQHVLSRMKALDCNLGGEVSGHIILSDYGMTSDGLVAALQVLAVLKKSGRKASEVLRCFDPVPQIKRDVEVSDAARVLSNDPFVELALEEARRLLDDKGRLVVRASGTEPMIRIMVECEERSLATRLVDSITDAVRLAKK